VPVTSLSNHLRTSLCQRIMVSDGPPADPHTLLHSAPTCTRLALTPTYQCPLRQCWAHTHLTRWHTQRRHSPPMPSCPCSTMPACSATHHSIQAWLHLVKARWTPTNRSECLLCCHLHYENIARSIVSPSNVFASAVRCDI
jgi:hypothetical protein